MNKALLTFLALSLSMSVNADNLVDTDQLDALAAQNHQTLTQQLLVLEADAIEQRLTRYGSVKQIWLRKLLINAISRQKQPTPGQRQWLLQQVDSEHVLRAQLNDIGHELPISVINIPAQARGLLAHFSAIDAANHWITELEQGRFSWQILFEQSVALRRNKTAFEHFLAMLKPAEKEDLIAQLLTKQSAGLDAPNLVLTLLAQHTQDAYHKSRLYQWLWRKPADQHSVSALKQLITADGIDTFKLMQQAADNPSLTSLSFNLLATHQSDSTKVQQYLFSQLSKPKTNSLAAAALAKITAPEVTTQLRQGVYSPDRQVAKASRLALSLSAQGESR